MLLADDAPFTVQDRDARRVIDRALAVLAVLHAEDGRELAGATTLELATIAAPPDASPLIDARRLAASYLAMRLPS